jgi:UDP-N-acetylglucosamine--N-acetylmuramyl-(pentapeptide) pyrophosphoryl-undecaprenol N-acetylglucosamine transferase
MRLKVVQQAREEDLPRVRDAYARAGRQAFRVAVLSDLAGPNGRKPSRGAHAPAPRRSPNSPPSAPPDCLVPLPHALDQDQNAQRQCWRRRRRDPLAQAWISRRIASRPKSQASASAPARICRHGQGATNSARRALTPPTNWRNWSSARPGFKR